MSELPLINSGGFLLFNLLFILSVVQLFILISFCVLVLYLSIEIFSLKMYFISENYCFIHLFIMCQFIC